MADEGLVPSPEEEIKRRNVIAKLKQVILQHLSCKKTYFLNFLEKKQGKKGQEKEKEEEGQEISYLHPGAQNFQHLLVCLCLI